MAKQSRCLLVVDRDPSVEPGEIGTTTHDLPEVSDDLRFIERLEKHDHGITGAIKSTRKSHSRITEKFKGQRGALLQAMSDCLEDTKKILER